MKAIFLSGLLFICSIAIYPQEVVYRSGEQAMLRGGYSIQSPSGNAAYLGFNNPSFLSRFKGTSFGISYQYASPIEKAYFADDNLIRRDVASGLLFSGKSIIHGLPYSASLTYQKGNFFLAGAIAQRYNLMYESPVIGVPHIGVKQMTRFEDIHDFSAIASYLIKNLPEDNSLSLGLRLSLGRLDYASYNRYGGLTDNLETVVYSLGYALGADYRFAVKSSIIALGAWFEKGEKYSKDINKLAQFHDNGSPATTFYPLYSMHVIDVATPDALTFDASFNMGRFQLMGTVSEVFWRNVSEIYKDNLDFSAGAEFMADSWLKLSLSASKSDRQYSDILKQVANNNFNYFEALFLTFGAEAQYGIYTFGFSLSDSHLISSETSQRTIGRLSLGMQL